MNFTVASDFWNSGNFNSSLQNSIASATEELKVWAANLTFIFCRVHSMWRLWSRFPALRPSLFWTSCNDLMNCHFISFPSLSTSTPLSANRFLISFNIWHASKKIQICWVGFIGWPRTNRFDFFKPSNLQTKEYLQTFSVLRGMLDSLSREFACRPLGSNSRPSAFLRSGFCRSV